MKQISDKHAARRWSPTMLLMLAGALGLLARAWTILHTARQGYAVDDLFDALAWNLATLGTFTMDGMTPSAHVGPLYPSVLAVFYRVAGHRPEWVPYLHAAFDVGASFCIFFVGRRLFGSWIGAIAAAAMFLYPAYWTYDPRIRSESLLTLADERLAVGHGCLPVLHTNVLLRGSRVAGRARHSVQAGDDPACRCAGRSMRSSAQIPFGSGRLVRASICLRVCLWCLPWTMRNYQAFGTVIPVSAGVGAGLWMGSDPLSRGSWPMPLTMESQIWESAGITPLPYAHAMYDVSTDQILRAKGWARITEAPVRYLWLTLTRAFDFWIGNSFYLMNSDQGFVQGLTVDAADRGWLMATYSVAKRLLLIPGLIGLSLWSAWSHQSRWRELLPLYMFPIGLMLGYIPFTVEAGRYALPVLPCLMVLSVAVLARMGLPMVSLRRRQPLPTGP